MWNINLICFSRERSKEFAIQNACLCYCKQELQTFGNGPVSLTTRTIQANDKNQTEQHFFTSTMEDKCLLHRI